MKNPMNVLPPVLRHVYPLNSGLGTISNSRVFRFLDGNPGGDVVASVGRLKLIVPQDDYVGRSIKYFGDLDRKITWVVRRVLRPGDTALDIGANLGLLSFKMLEQVGEEGKVISFEPQSRMARYIERSISHNGIGNLSLQNIGLGDREGSLRLAIPEHNAGAASFVAGKEGRFEEVPVTTLDAFYRGHGLRDVRLIKIDVEGFEAQVFKGGEEFFTVVKPDVIVFEENDRSADIPESVSLVRSLGYEVYSLPKSLLSVKLETYRSAANAHDFVAVHQDASADLRRRLGILKA